jgi:hypothetical protein
MSQNTKLEQCQHMFSKVNLLVDTKTHYATSCTTKTKLHGLSQRAIYIGSATQLHVHVLNGMTKLYSLSIPLIES